MFVVDRDEDGFAIAWEPGECAVAREFKTELTLEGLQRGREWELGITVLPYRNAYETLDLLVALLDRLGIEARLSEQLTSDRLAANTERELLARVRAAQAPAPHIGAELDEFATSRRLLPYQQLAVARHLAVQNSAEFSVPGAGKTMVALAYWAIARRDNPDLGLWVIGPFSCFRPWEDEFAACFGRDARSLRICGTPRERGQQLDRVTDFELVFSSYHTSWREQRAITDALGRRTWLLVLDEGHYVKSMTGALAGTVRALAPRAARRLVLTGTPMPRSPEDLWSLFTFLWPTEELLGNSQQHALRCKRPVEEVCEELREQLRPFFHRTCKRDLGLPEIESQYPVIAAADIPATQRLLLRLIERRTVEEVEFLRPVDQRHLRRWRRARMIRLLQAASNPLLLANALNVEDVLAAGEDSDEAPDVSDQVIVPLSDTDSDLAGVLRQYRDARETGAKVSYVAQRVRTLVAAGNKVVVWTVFLGNVALLEQLLADLRPLSISGSVPPYDAEDDEAGEATREQRIELFKTDPQRQVLLANAAACAESISLHRVCQHAIYLERSFNAAHFMQSLDRIHRQGMPAGTTAHVEIPFLSCSIERVLNRRLADRQTRLYRLLDDPMPVIGFDDESQTGLFDLDESEAIDELFEEVLAQIRADHS